jgi:hypothetical protein
MSAPTHVLLLPAVRVPRSRHYTDPSSPTLANKSPKPKQPRSRLSSPQPPHLLPEFLSPPSVGHAWLGNNALFEVVQDHLVLKGYQLFAVEKWSVCFSSPLRSPILPRVTQRTRPIITLAVYTGDSRHKVGHPFPPYFELVLSVLDRLL